MDPFTILMLMQVAQGTMQYAQDSANAEYQAAWAERTERLNRELTVREAIRNYNSVSRRLQEVETGIAKDIQRVTRQSLMRAGTARVTAAEGGVSGGSVAALVRMFEGRAGEAATTLEQNRTASRLQAKDVKQSVFESAKARILGAQQPPTQKPNFFSALLGIGGGIGGAYFQTHDYSEDKGWYPSWK